MCYGLARGGEADVMRPGKRKRRIKIIKLTEGGGVDYDGGMS